MSEVLLVTLIFVALAAVWAVLQHEPPAGPTPDAFWREAEKMCRTIEGQEGKGK